ncbi:MAG: DNA polymerase III subunit gamma/tau [Bryobacteraceae bacterium]
MYQVIARKYRPQNFSELIGQEHVQKTLANAIESNRLAHGYIFSGQRGTGKTTVARILARCLNCIQGPTATPCSVCSSCIEISSGSSVDVIEIDAASNRGINEMREIRENVRYRPARDKYKVFIIDEAHQITKEAFNALLKTLEEPPEWVVFILCTTEASEIPNTIASRCQHFSFRSVDFGELMVRMKQIAQQEGIEASDEALSVIAQAGEGSVRDSLSALDQAIACCGSTLKVADVRALLGMFGAESLRSVADAVQNADGAKMLDIVSDLERHGQSLQHFCRELSRYWRNLLVSKIAGRPTSLIAASDVEQAEFLETAKGFSEEDLTRFLSLTLAVYKELQTSLQPRLHLELGLVKLVHAGRLKSIEEAIANLGTPDSTPTRPKVAPSEPIRERLQVSAPPPSALVAPPLPKLANVTGAPKPVAETPRPVAAAVQPESTPAPVEISEALDSSLKQKFYDGLCGAGLQFSADAVMECEVELKGGELVLRGPKGSLFSLKDPKVQTVATQVVGKAVKVRLEAGAAAASTGVVTKSTNGKDTDSALRERALEHPGVKRFQELFPDAQVRTVRNLNE